MPRPPHVASAVAEIKGSVYSALLHRIASHRGEVYPFHVGDTWKRPPEACRLESVRGEDVPGLNQYTAPQGLPALVDAVVDRVRARTGVDVERANAFVTGGATAGLAAAVGAVAGPGDEVLLLSPHWPLIDGIVRMFGATPVQVPFFGDVDSVESAVDAVQKRATPRAVALYVNTPNNPTGRVIPHDWLEALAAWARQENLWLLFDEVYEDLVYEGAHTYGLALAPEHALAAHSFSKSYGMAGYRCGYLVGPEMPMREALKLATHTVYSATTSSQHAALRVLKGAAEEWLRQTREEYRAVGRAAAARLGLPPPQGSTFLFVDVAERLGDGGLQAFLEGCADEGLFLAPGPSFGPYPTHVRLCFTASPPEVVARGVEVLARKIGR